MTTDAERERLMAQAREEGLTGDTLARYEEYLRGPLDPRD